LVRTFRAKEKVQNDKQRSKTHENKTEDRVTRTPLITESKGELMCSGRMSSSCSTRDTRRVDLVTNPLISHERGKDREVFTTNGTYSWSCVTQIVILYFFLWPLCCLFFDLRILITTLVSSNSSY
jgi:hypothetical protein